jgi:hypothetical protein
MRRLIKSTVRDWAWGSWALYITYLDVGAEGGREGSCLVVVVEAEGGVDAEVAVALVDVVEGEEAGAHQARAREDVLRVGLNLWDDALAPNAGRGLGRLVVVGVRVVDHGLLEDGLVDHGLVDGLLEDGLVVNRGRLGIDGGGLVVHRGGLVVHRGGLVLHVEEPLRGVVLVLVEGAGGRVEGGGGVAAEGDRTVGVGPL